MPTVRLTPREAEIMQHRLTLDDCISEAITDCDPPSPHSQEQVAEAARRLERELATSRTLTIETALDLEIVEDVVDGNTFGVGLDDGVGNEELTPAEASAWRRTMRALNSKLAKIGVQSVFPM